MPTDDDSRDDIPSSIGGPAMRALDAAGIRTLSDVAGLTAAQLLALHGVGPRAIRLLRAWLEKHGQNLRSG